VARRALAAHRATAAPVAAPAGDRAHRAPAAEAARASAGCLGRPSLGAPDPLRAFQGNPGAADTPAVGRKAAAEAAGDNRHDHQQATAAAVDNPEVEEGGGQEGEPRNHRRAAGRNRVGARSLAEEADRAAARNLAALAAALRSHRRLRNRGWAEARRNHHRPGVRSLVEAGAVRNRAADRSPAVGLAVPRQQGRRTRSTA
jgi:hypothetical protein